MDQAYQPTQCLAKNQQERKEKKMSFGGGIDESAEEIFWRTPEVVEKLIEFLDRRSILILATCHDLTKHILQRTSVWPKVIRRSCPVKVKRTWDERALVAKSRKKLWPLVALLKIGRNG